MKKAEKAPEKIAAPVQVGDETLPPHIPTEPTIFGKIESFKKELDAIADLGRGGRWARAIRNLKDMQKDLGALAKEIHTEYLVDID